MAQEDVAANGATTVVEKSVTFTAYKRQLIVDAQKVGDAVAFNKAVFDAVETGHSLYPKRKADQELPHLVSSELKLAGTTVVVSDVSVNSGSDAKTGTMPAILETDDVEAAVAKAVAAGAVVVEADGGVTDPFGFTGIFVSPGKESEKDGNKEFVFCGISGMVLEVQSETRSAVKRRRMLHFDDQPMETSLYSSECFSSILKSSAREEACDELLPEGSQLIEGFSEDASVSSLEGLDLFAAELFADCLYDPETPTLSADLEVLDLYAAKLYADCLNDRETPTLPDDLSFGSPEVQIDVSETETREVRRPVTRSSSNVIFKGRKSFAWLVPKLTSSIIYPFALIKPCGVHGDMTLKDINQKIRTPAAKPKEDKADPPVIQTSAFSGKPVVGKTKFRTEGGKGSITIMRTRG